jgi:hypothetical protein
MADTPIDLPPDLAGILSQYLKPEDISSATLVDTPNNAAPSGRDIRSAQPAEPCTLRRDARPFTKMTIYVSYIPSLRCFSGHREGLGEIRAASMPELLSQLETKFVNVDFTLVLSKVARAEVARRKVGGPMPRGWY